MANVFATKSSNWSDTTMWNTGALPTSSDDVYANGFTVTINQNITVLSIRTTSATSINAGGGFTVNGSYTISAELIGGASTALTCSTGSITVTIVGNITAGNSGNSTGLTLSSNATINITGNVTAGTGSNNRGILTSLSNGTVNITGSVNASSGSSNSVGIENQTNANITITGNVFGATQAGINNVSTGVVTITGSVTGGSGAVGIINTGAGTVIINGSAIGGTGAAGANNNSTGTMRATRAIGNQSTASTSGVVGSNSAGTTVIREAEYGPLGQAPTGGFVRFENSNVCLIQVRREDLTNRVLSDPLNVANLVPAATDVRSGVTYNNGTRTGSLIVPSPANVRRGVATDNTTGTADLTAADFWNHLTSNLTTSGSIGERLKNAATVASTGDQIAAALNT